MASSLSEGFLSTSLPINPWVFLGHKLMGLWGTELTENPWLAKTKLWYLLLDEISKYFC